MNLAFINESVHDAGMLARITTWTSGRQTSMAAFELETNASKCGAFNASKCSIYDDQNIFGRTDIWITFFSLYTLVFFGCFFGNLLVIVVVATSRRLRSTTNIFLANLAIADLSVGIFCVYQNLLVYLVKSWVLGDFVCKMYHFIHNLSYTASIFILVVLSVERYLAILRPMTCRSILTSQRIRMSVMAVWLASGALCVMRFHWAHAVTSSGPEPKIICISNRPRSNQELWDWMSFVLFYVVPLAIISTLYTRIGLALWSSAKINVQQPGASPSVVSGRRRAVRLLAAIVTTFAVCHLPLHGRRFWLHWLSQYPKHLSDIVTPFTYLAAYANSAVNPLLYSLLSRNFRAAMGDLVQAATVRWPSTPGFVRRKRRRRCSPGDASDSSPQTTLTSRGDSLRITCPMKCEVTRMLPDVHDESGRDLIRAP